VQGEINKKYALKETTLIHRAFVASIGNHLWKVLDMPLPCMGENKQQHDERLTQVLKRPCLKFDTK